MLYRHNFAGGLLDAFVYNSKAATYAFNNLGSHTFPMLEGYEARRTHCPILPGPRNAPPSWLPPS